MKEEKIKKTINGIIEIFESGDLPEKIAIATFPPYEGIPSSSWSLLNRVIMMNKGRTDDSRGYKQWKEIGRNVKKGSRCFHILGPKIAKREKENKDTGEKEQYQICTGFFTIPVFAVEDTEGKDLEYKRAELPDLPLLEKAQEWGIDVAPMAYNFGRYLGFFRENGDKQEIKLCSPHENIFFHELSHAAHKRVLGTLDIEKSRKEIVAELSAQVLSLLVGLEKDSTLGNSYNYISKYAKKENKDIGKACLQVIGDVEKVLNLILN